MPAARARRAGPRHGRARVGGSPEAARGFRLRGRARGAGSRLLRDEGRRAAVRRSGGGARAGARLRRNCLGPARALRSAGSPPSRRRASRVPGRHSSSRPGRKRGFLAPLPMSFLPLPPTATRSSKARCAQLGRARGATGWSGRGTARPGRTAGVGARARRREARACVAGGRPPSSWRRSSSRRRSETS